MDIKKLDFIDEMWGKNVFSKLESGVHATFSKTVTRKSVLNQADTQKRLSLCTHVFVSFPTLYLF